MWLMGGGDLARAFLHAGLVDDLHLGIVPTLPGDGLPASPAGFPEQTFALIESRTYSRGLVTLKYRRV